jgi:OOP family OmpA-OmpF porin
MVRVRVLAGVVLLLFLGAGCARTHFGVVDKATFVPKDFAITEEVLKKAEMSEGARHCPEKIARAKELATQAAQTYWACRTEEAMNMLAEARKLAREAEGCQPPPKPVAKPAPPPPPPPPPKIATLGETHFAFDSYELTSAGEAVLDGAARLMMERPDIELVEIAGHTCHIGTDAYNQTLSENRAQSVKKYLISKGISRGRLKAVGYGKTRPIATNTTEQGRRKNRRVELIVLD